MTRAVSTPLDAALAVLLVTAGAAVLVGVHPPRQPAPSPARVADTVLSVTTNVSCRGRETPVRAPLGSLLASAADGRSPQRCTRRATTHVLAAVTPPVNLTLVSRGDRVLAVGPTPRSRRIRATVAPLPGGDDATAVVRTWSP